MVSSRLTAISLETAPVATLAVLAGWAFSDFLGIPGTALAQGFIGLLLLGLAALVLGLQLNLPAIRRTGLALVAVSYLGAHVFVLPLDPAAVLGFLALVLVAIELRILTERFAPILRMDLSPGDRDCVTEALARSFLRIVAASAVGFLGSYLTADLALSGALPLRSIATALVLSMSLIAVVLLLALWPLLERQLGERESAKAPIQTAK